MPASTAGYDSTLERRRMVGAVTDSDVSTIEPVEKQEKMRRQRNKFLAVFLGSKAATKNKTPEKQTAPVAAVNNNSLQRKNVGHFFNEYSISMIGVLILNRRCQKRKKFYN